MKILLTGGRGKAGTAMVQAFVDRGHDITIADIKDCSTMYDLTQYDKARNAVEGRDVVVHLAGIPHPSSKPFRNYFRTNVLLSHNILLASLEMGVKRVIYASSSASYGTDAAFRPRYVPIDEEHPFSVDMEAEDEKAHWQYPCSKRMVDMMMLAYGKSTRLETVILRMGPLHNTENYFGGLDAQEWARRCLFGWSDPRDIPSVFIAAAEKPGLKCEVFNIMGTYFPKDFRPDGLDPLDWLRELCEKKGIEQLPASQDWAKERVLPDGRHLSFYSSEKAKKVLGWEPKY